LAIGAPPPQYQWLFNGVPVPGATNATFRRDTADLNDTGEYSVRASNEAGAVVSRTVMLKVIPPHVRGR